VSDASPPPDAPRIPSYWDYLRVEDLLALQGGVEGDESQLSNHEVLFIVVHQVYELWFKLVLRELTTARDLMHQNPVPDERLSRAAASIRRVREILDHCVSHFRVMETLSTRDFLDFRDKLLPASGFQSAQMRELEILLGLKDEKRVHLGWEGSYMAALQSHDGSPSPALARVERRKADTPSLRAAVDEWLYRTPIRGSSPDDDGDASVVDAFIADFLAAHRKELDGTLGLAARQARSDEERERLAQRYEQTADAARAFLQADDAGEADRRRRSRIRAALVFIESYRALPLLSWPREVVDQIVALEQAFVMFRQRHARMVEREIGRRVGTGGSAGVDYLDETALRYRIFEDFWAVRTILVRRDAVPDLAEGEFYGFRFGG
jgi:tryptophan 2,3-dioxygenase